MGRPADYARIGGRKGAAPTTFSREAHMKARIFRAGIAIAMLAASLQAFGAYIKW